MNLQEYKTLDEAKELVDKAITDAADADKLCDLAENTFLDGSLEVGVTDRLGVILKSIRLMLKESIEKSEKAYAKMYGVLNTQEAPATQEAKNAGGK
jgi:hypothetical protein